MIKWDITGDIVGTKIGFQKTQAATNPTNSTLITDQMVMTWLQYGRPKKEVQKAQTIARARVIAGLKIRTEDTVQQNALLTPGERKIMQLLLLNGLNNKEIGEKLDIAEQTVKNHINNMFDKVGVSTRVELILWAKRYMPPIDGNESKPVIGVENMSPTQMLVVKEVQDGLSNKEIAKRVFRSKSTVRNQISETLRELGFKNRTEIVLCPPIELPLDQQQSD